MRGDLYLEVVEIVHDLIVVHVQVVEAEGFDGRVRGVARVHGIADDRSALHFGGTASCERGRLSVKSFRKFNRL